MTTHVVHIMEGDDLIRLVTTVLVRRSTLNLWSRGLFLLPET
jgi:hypothetical protein